MQQAREHEGRCAFVGGWSGGLCLLVTILMLTLASVVAADRKNSAAATALDLDGKPADPFAVTNASATVLIFVGHECPIANRYAPEIRRLHEKFSPRGVRFWIVYADADTTVEQIRQHVREFTLPGDALRDPKQALARRSKAKVTPEGAVFTAAGRLVYHGRIDDRYADFGKQRPEPTQRDLSDAIESVLAGKKPRSASAAAVGCRIPNL